MPLSRAVLERQLKLAESTVAARTKELEKSGKTGDALARDPHWRSAQAMCTSIRRRLVAVGKTEAINAEVIRRRNEPKPEPEPKPAKPKVKAKPDKSKAEAAPKAKAEGGDKKPKKGKGDKAEK